jgi:hypothetical protein
MIFPLSYDIAEARRSQALARAEQIRERRAARRHVVRDALGHGLIAIGSRLVTTPTDNHPTVRRAA